MSALIEDVTQRMWLDKHKVEGITQVVAPPVPGVWLSTPALEKPALSKWDERFMDMAHLVATWSKDPSTKVGSCIVDSKKRIVSVGFNGSPVGVGDVGERTTRLMRTVHAEVNAATFANRSIEGCTIYVTHAPCSNCAAILIQHGIAEAVFPKPADDFLERWGESYKEALAMFGEAGVNVREICDAE